MFKRLTEKVKNNSKIKTILNICLLVSMSLYIFSIPSFSGREKLYLISYGFMALLFLFVVIYYLFYEKFVFNKRLLILLLFAIEAFIGTAIYSHDFRHWLTIVLLFLTLVIFYYSFNAIKNNRLIFMIIAFAFLAFGIYFAFHYRKDIFSFNLNDPLGTYFDNVNTIGTYFSLGTILFLYLAMTNKRKIEWLYLFPCVLMLFLGLFTGSRHFIITTGVAYIATILVCFKKKKWLAALIVAAAIVSFFLIIQLPFLSQLKERIDRGITTLFGVGDAKYDPSVVQRTIWPQYGFNIGSKEFLFGFGAEGFSIYSGIGTYSHNTYSEIVCNFGIFGAIIFFFAFLYPLVLAIRSRNRAINITIIVVIFYLIKGFFGVYFASKDAYMIIALLIYLTKDIRLGEYIEFVKHREIRAKTFYEVQI